MLLWTQIDSFFFSFCFLVWLVEGLTAFVCVEVRFVFHFNSLNFTITTEKVHLLCVIFFLFVLVLMPNVTYTDAIPFNIQDFVKTDSGAGTFLL